MLAKALEGTLAQQVTQPGQLLGDIPYMAPERTRANMEVDTRSDLYGLGATCYALLTGRPPSAAIRLSKRCPTSGMKLLALPSHTNWPSMICSRGL